MIAEWFYPKEFKDVIADLRAKDDLNEEALSRVNNIPVAICVFWLVVIVFYWFTLESLSYFVGAFLVSLLAAIFLLFACIDSGCKSLLTYHKGKLKRGIFLSLKSHGSLPYVSLIILDQAANKNIRMGIFNYDLVKDFIPEHKATISYYSLDEKFNMPDYEPIKKQYCLSLSQLKGNES